jgi:hypothetical protein
MKCTTQTFNVLPRLEGLLSEVTDTPKLATALLDALAKHIDLKTDLLKQRIRAFESKWKMTFEEFEKFSERTEDETLPRNLCSYDVETDFRAWKQTITLLKHYESLQIW